MATEMRWQIEQRTVRDCPGGRTELEWRAAVAAAQKEADDHRVCSKCGADLSHVAKYIITETESWLPGDAPLPRGRWALSARAGTLRAARKLQQFLGPRAVIWIRKDDDGYIKLKTKG